MQLAPAITTYFTANDADSLATAFAPAAQVLDEGRTHIGPKAIAAWWQAAKLKYNHIATPIDHTTEGDKTLVRAHVQGNFPGSPLILRFAFGLEGGLISSLRITA